MGGEDVSSRSFCRALARRAVIAWRLVLDVALIAWTIALGAALSAFIGLVTCWLADLGVPNLNVGPIEEMIIKYGKIVGTALRVLMFVGFEVLECPYVLKRIKEGHSD